MAEAIEAILRRCHRPVELRPLKRGILGMARDRCTDEGKLKCGLAHTTFDEKCGRRPGGAVHWPRLLGIVEIDHSMPAGAVMQGGAKVTGDQQHAIAHRQVAG